MNKLLAIGTVVGLVGGASAGIVEALPRVASAESPDAVTTISFVEHELSDVTFHLGPKSGVYPGMVEVAASDDMQGAKKIGYDGGSCVITRRSAGTADDLCNITFVLAGGQIDISGLTTSTPSGPGTFKMAIVGGTGVFANAQGEATVVPANSPQVTLETTG